MEHQDIKTMELKAIKHMASLSEETFCYSANVYINGKKAISVSNSGHGGCDNQDEVIKGALSAAEDYCKRHGDASFLTGIHEKNQADGEDRDPVMWHSLESWCSDEVSNHLARKELNKDLKKKVVILDKEDGKAYMYPIRQQGRDWPVDTIVNAVASAEKYPKGFVVINNIEDKSEQLKVYRKSTEPQPCGQNDWCIEFTPVFDADGNCTNIPSPKGK